MKYIVLFILLIVSLRGWATVGEPIFISELYYSFQDTSIYYLLDYGHGQEVYQQKLSDENAVLKKDYDNSEGYVNKKRWDDLKKRCTPLQRINLAKSNFKFTSWVNSIQSHPIFNWNQLSSQDKSTNKFFLTDGVANVDYKIAIYYQKKLLKIHSISSCLYRDKIVLEAYSLPNLNYIVWISRTISICFEYQYVSENVFITPYSIPIDKHLGDTCSVIAPEYVTYMDGAFDYKHYRIVKRLAVSNLAKRLNSIGLTLYQKQEYHDAILFFQSAIEISENYTIPLYNEACSYALLGDLENTLLILERLLKIQPKYLAKIQNDQDFDLFRKNLQFQQFLLKH